MTALSPENQILLNAIGDVSSRVKSLEEIVCQSTRSSGSLLDEARKHSAQIDDLGRKIEEIDARASKRIDDHEKAHHQKTPRPTIGSELAIHGAKQAIGMIVVLMMTALGLGIVVILKPHIIQGALP